MDGEGRMAMSRKARTVKAGLVAFHYPSRDYSEEMLGRVRRAAEFIASRPGCLGVDCWFTEDGEAIVSTGQWESQEALLGGFAAARAAGIDFRVDEREVRPREIFRLTGTNGAADRRR
ncbi:MAG: antibiotic biosynthesis monooxygenase [Streptosporangiaceae bacterium]